MHALYKKYVMLIAEHFQNEHKVSFYSKALGITTRDLIQVTVANCGYKPKEILDNYLLKESMILLETTNLSIKEVALRMGFNSQATFCRFFISQDGRTPSVYRDLYQSRLSD